MHGGRSLHHFEPGDGERVHGAPILVWPLAESGVVEPDAIHQQQRAEAGETADERRTLAVGGLLHHRPRRVAQRLRQGTRQALSQLPGLDRVHDVWQPHRRGLNAPRGDVDLGKNDKIRHGRCIGPLCECGTRSSQEAQQSQAAMNPHGTHRNCQHLSSVQIVVPVSRVHGCAVWNQRESRASGGLRKVSASLRSTTDSTGGIGCLAARLKAWPAAWPPVVWPARCICPPGR